MGDVAEFFEYWRMRIEKDLSPFADPGTQLDVSGDRRVLVAHWTARGRAFEAGFALSLEAGSGKTRVLQELVKEQAQLYQRGQTDRLYLYINAQGRALARFNEALATELQDLRAAVTYHAVSALVRLGILVPVIDGFDELL